MKKESVEEYLMRGGKIQELSPEPEPAHTKQTKGRVKNWQRTSTGTKGRFK